MTEDDFCTKLHPRFYLFRNCQRLDIWKYTYIFRSERCGNCRFLRRAVGAAKAVICCANLLQKAKLLRFSLLRFLIVEKLCKMVLFCPFCVRFFDGEHHFFSGCRPNCGRLPKNYRKSDVREIVGIVCFWNFLFILQYHPAFLRADDVALPSARRKAGNKVARPVAVERIL